MFKIEDFRPLGGIFSGDPGAIRTRDSQLRRLVLYPAELQGLQGKDYRTGFSACQSGHPHAARRPLTVPGPAEAPLTAGFISKWYLVLGLIESFRDVEKLKVVGNPSVVASGVWQALITTAAGLIIAIPTYAMYRYFRSRISQMLMEMESNAFNLVQKLTAAEVEDLHGDKS